MPLTPGTTLGSYTILSAIGAGGMGEVYRARDARLDREVAIKVLPESFAADADRAARFTREAKTLASLNHPNIAQIFGVEEQGATRALVMELVDGQDLSELIAAHGPAGLPLADALPLAKQVADALEAAHDQGIVHRDVKPGRRSASSAGSMGRTRPTSRRMAGRSLGGCRALWLAVRRPLPGCGAAVAGPAVRGRRTTASKLLTAWDQGLVCSFITRARRHSQVVRQRSAKPLCTGSNPVAASSFPPVRTPAFLR